MAHDNSCSHYSQTPQMAAAQGGCGGGVTWWCDSLTLVSRSKVTLCQLRLNFCLYLLTTQCSPSCTPLWVRRRILSLKVVKKKLHKICSNAALGQSLIFPLNRRQPILFYHYFLRWPSWDSNNWNLRRSIWVKTKSMHHTNPCYACIPRFIL